MKEFSNTYYIPCTFTTHIITLRSTIKYPTISKTIVFISTFYPKLKNINIGSRIYLKVMPSVKATTVTNTTTVIRASRQPCKKLIIFISFLPVDMDKNFIRVILVQ